MTEKQEDNKEKNSKENPPTKSLAETKICDCGKVIYTHELCYCKREKPFNYEKK